MHGKRDGKLDEVGTKTEYSMKKKLIFNIWEHLIDTRYLGNFENVRGKKQLWNQLTSFNHIYSDSTHMA